MQKLKLLSVHFDTEIPPREIEHFRGAIIERVGAENDLFHNHNATGVIYRYPLIQYKLHQHRPMLFCLGEGVLEAQKIFMGGPLELHMKHRTLSMEAYRLNLHQANVQLWRDASLSYYIRNWLALNQEAYQYYNSLEGIAERIQFLESRLIGNILAFANGIGWQVPGQIVCKITDISGPKPIHVNDTVLNGFDAAFQTNVSLPNLIGLGKSVAKGFGVVWRKD